MIGYSMQVNNQVNDWKCKTIFWLFSSVSSMFHLSLLKCSIFSTWNNKKKHLAPFFSFYVLLCIVGKIFYSQHIKIKKNVGKALPTYSRRIQIQPLRTRDKKILKDILKPSFFATNRYIWLQTAHSKASFFDWRKKSLSTFP